MQRNAFLKWCLSLSGLGVIPFTGAAQFADRIKKGFKVESGKDRFGKSLSPFKGDTFFTKVSTQDTDGDFFIFESTRLDEGGPAMHVHFDQDEWWYILEGEFLVKIGEETFTAKAGDSVFGPRKVPHAFSKVGTGMGRLILLFQPAGKMEAFFKAVNDGVMRNKTEEEQDQIRIEHGFKRVGPALTIWKRPDQ